MTHPEQAEIRFETLVDYRFLDYDTWEIITKNNSGVVYSSIGSEFELYRFLQGIGITVTRTPLWMLYTESVPLPTTHKNLIKRNSRDIERIEMELYKLKDILDRQITSFWDYNSELHRGSGYQNDFKVRYCIKTKTEDFNITWIKNTGKVSLEIVNVMPPTLAEVSEIGELFGMYTWTS
jgi:hypothetical protein